jgi:hypothetical protein
VYGWSNPLEDRDLDACGVDEADAAVTPRLVGGRMDQLRTGREQLIVQRIDRVVLDRQEDPAHRRCVGILEEFDPPDIAVPDDATTAAAVLGRPLTGDRPAEHLMLEVTGLVEAGGGTHHAELHRRTVALGAREALPTLLLRSPG